VDAAAQRVSPSHPRQSTSCVSRVREEGNFHDRKVCQHKDLAATTSGGRDHFGSETRSGEKIFPKMGNKIDLCRIIAP
jgi:hypothetical protein